MSNNYTLVVKGCDINDKQFWNTPKGKYAVAMVANSCVGDGACTAEGTQKEGYSINCSKCFGGLSDCGRINCAFECMFGTNEKCKTCVMTSCNDSFEKCSGLKMLNH